MKYRVVRTYYASHEVEASSPEEAEEISNNTDLTGCLQLDEVTVDELD
jgi:hypothetical protein